MLALINWTCERESGAYKGYVGRLKVFEIICAPSIAKEFHRYRRVKGFGDWVFKTELKFLRPIRFETPSAAKYHAANVIKRIMNCFDPEELKKDFQP